MAIFPLSRSCRDKGEYRYEEVRRWTLEKRLVSSGQASKSILDCDRVIIPVRRLNSHVIQSDMQGLDVVIQLDEKRRCARRAAASVHNCHRGAMPVATDTGSL